MRITDPNKQTNQKRDRVFGAFVGIFIGIVFGFFGCLFLMDTIPLFAVSTLYKFVAACTIGAIFCSVLGYRYPKIMAIIAFPISLIFGGIG